jgi:hypothetical protein
MKTDYSKCSKSELCWLLINTVRQAKKLPLLPKSPLSKSKQTKSDNHVGYKKIS